MLKMNYTKRNELDKEKIFSNDMVNSEIYILFDSLNLFNLSKTLSNNISKNTKYFKILDKTPFYILKIENEIYLIRKEKIKEVKKYLYKNKVNKNILLSDIINPSKTTKNYHMLKKGLQIEELELINVKNINSIKEFKVLTLNNKDNIIKDINKNNQAIHLKKERSFLEVKDDLEFFINNNNYLEIERDLKCLLLSLLSIKKEEKNDYTYFEYSKINIVGNYIEIKRNKEQEYININNILKLKTKKEKKELKFVDPFGKEFCYIFYIIEVHIYTNKKNPEMFYCFEEDLKKNELLKVNENKILKEI